MKYWQISYILLVFCPRKLLIGHERVMHRPIYNHNKPTYYRYAIFAYVIDTLILCVNKFITQLHHVVLFIGDHPS